MIEHQSSKFTEKYEDYLNLGVIEWRKSFEEHEKSHADKIFNAKFADLAQLCTDSQELGYEMLWQGESDPH